MSPSARLLLLSFCAAAPVSLAHVPAAATPPCAAGESAQLAAACVNSDDTSQRDSDDDGASDAEERGDDGSARDSDADGVPDFEDRDDDGDGISSERERLDAMTSGVSDLDEDGLDNWLDPDADGDGALDADEGRGNADRDRQLGYLDADELGALEDGCRFGADGDLDGLGDACDLDADGDGIEDGLHIAGGGLLSCASTSSSTPLALLLLFALSLLARRRGGARRAREPARRAVAAGLVALATTVGATTTMADPGTLPGERFRPAIDAGGVLGAEAAALPEAPLAFDAAVWSGYALNPLVLRTADGDRRRSLIAHRMSSDVVMALSLLGRVQLGLDLPLVLFQSATLPADVASFQAQGLSSAALGDLRLVPKVQLLREAEQLVDVAVAGEMTLPTGALRTSYQTEGNFSFAPSVLVGRTLGPVRLLANLGYRLREQRVLAGVAVGPELFYAAAAAVDVFDLPVRLDASLLGATGVATHGGNPSSLEVLGGVTVAVFGPFEISVGGGVGLLAGFGTPDARGFAAVRYAPRYPGAWTPGVSAEPPPALPSVDAGALRAELASLQRVTFAAGRAELTEESLPLLDEVARLLHEHPSVRKLRIAGHTDVEGDAITNLALSEQRAQVVMRYLLQRGIAPARLEARGFGASRPIADNRTATGRERNRRVELIILELDDARLARR